MAFFSELVGTIAVAEGMDVMTVSGIGQYLRKAELISKSGRGTSAARMTSRDAANLLIAVNGAGAAKDAASAVAEFRALGSAGRTFGATMPWYAEVSERDTFGAALERLIDACRTDEAGAVAIEDALARATWDFSEADLRRMERGGILPATAYLELELRRPLLRAEIRTLSPYFHEAAGEIHFAESSRLAFGHIGNDGLPSDRRDTTVITERTLRAVASTLQD